MVHEPPPSTCLFRELMVAWFARLDFARVISMTPGLSPSSKGRGKLGLGYVDFRFHLLHFLDVHRRCPRPSPESRPSSSLRSQQVGSSSWLDESMVCHRLLPSGFAPGARLRTRYPTFGPLASRVCRSSAPPLGTRAPPTNSYTRLRSIGTLDSRRASACEGRRAAEQEQRR